MTGSCVVVDALARAQRLPDRFQVPSAAVLRDVRLGDYVKIILVPEGGHGERVWVQVREIGADLEGFTEIKGVLDSFPLQSDIMPQRGTFLSFYRKNVVNIEKL